MLRQPPKAMHATDVAVAGGVGVTAPKAAATTQRRRLA
jgi:hypothetical protein